MSFHQMRYSRADGSLVDEVVAPIDDQLDQAMLEAPILQEFRAPHNQLFARGTKPLVIGAKTDSSSPLRFAPDELGKTLFLNLDFVKRL